MHLLCHKMVGAPYSRKGKGAPCCLYAQHAGSNAMRIAAGNSRRIRSILNTVKKKHNHVECGGLRSILSEEIS